MQRYIGGLLAVILLAVFSLMPIGVQGQEICIGGSVSIPTGNGGGISIGGSSGGCGGGFGFGGASFMNNPFGLPSGSILGIVAAFAFWLLALFGFIGIIGFVIAGILYLTAAGNETQIDTAKTAMLYSIVGVVVALIGFVIIQAVNRLLNAAPQFFSRTKLTLSLTIMQNVFEIKS